VRVVLVQQVDLLDVLLVLHEGGHRFHLHRRVGVEAEVPEAALAVGQIGVDRRLVQEDHFLARVALVVLVDRIDQRERDRRAVALDDVAHALVGRRLQRVQALGRAELVVHPDHFELHAGRVGGVELLREELPALQLVVADRRHQAGERIDPSHLDDLPVERLAPLA
jgi:hypothetical protein